MHFLDQLSHLLTFLQVVHWSFVIYQDYKDLIG
jgi:hypothetical protein